MLRRTGVFKEFGPEGFKVIEEVAERSSLDKYSGCGMNTDTFTLRIDADEYTAGSFSRYYPLFEKYSNMITIFFNVNSFKDAKEEIIKCRDIGIDVQSHAFYHYTYDDYASNRYNIGKAKSFFKEIGIETKGFVAPLGRWNASLMKALEDEGYLYASEFSYDYMGFPSYPHLGERPSSILEIPVFPVAPELFFQEEKCDQEKVLEFYKDAIDEMIRFGIPVIIYGHTHPLMPEIPGLLERICDYAAIEKKLKPVSMSGLCDVYKRKVNERGVSGSGEKECPGKDFLGEKVFMGMKDRMKYAMKNILDFEKVTPEEELRSGIIRRKLKILARKVFN